jgi:hypothetical protein
LQNEAVAAAAAEIPASSPTTKAGTFSSWGKVDPNILGGWCIQRSGVISLAQGRFRDQLDARKCLRQKDFLE